MTIRERIEDFLAQKRIAIAGVSRNEKDFSRTVFREFVRRGYDVVPVNPNAEAVEDVPCAAHLDAISGKVDGVLLMTSPAVTDQMVKECAAAGIPRVWMYRAVGAGAVSQEAVEFCEAHGIAVIPGWCPFMFFHETPFFHRAHGFVLKLFGGYPK